MSFGYSIGDAVLLTQLAFKTVQNARKACGEHDELTQEVLSLHMVLRRLERAVKKPKAAFNTVRSDESDNEQLHVIVGGCRRVLNILDQVLTKYNALGDQERSGRRLWQKIKFGNGEMADLAEMRGKLIYWTTAMSLFLKMVSMGTMGRVERQMNDAGGDLKEIKAAVNGITAHLLSSSNRHEGSVLTAYADDDRAVWKEFRRELLEDGFSSSVIRKHKRLIKAYIEELGSRGLLDEDDPNMDVKKHCCNVDSPVEQATAHNTETEDIPEASSETVSEAESEAKSVVESLVESTPQADFIEPKTESRSEIPSPERERPIKDTFPEIDSQLKSKLDMYSISDENATRLLHSIRHEIYDDIVQPLIEWGRLPFRERRQIHIAALIDSVSRLSAYVRSLPLPRYDLSIRKDLQGLLREVENISGSMELLGKYWIDESWEERVLTLLLLIDVQVQSGKITFLMEGVRLCCQRCLQTVSKETGGGGGREEGHALLSDVTTP